MRSFILFLSPTLILTHSLTLSLTYALTLSFSILQPKYDGDLLVVLRKSLEHVYPVDATLSTLELSRGKDDKRVVAGEFKGNIAVFTPYNIHGPEVCKCIIYIV